MYNYFEILIGRSKNFIIFGQSKTAVILVFLPVKLARFKRVKHVTL